MQREAAYALGATRWEVTRIAVLSSARRGLCGAVILGLGRALGETMAVTMLIGNGPKILREIDMVGTDLNFITGTCGKGDHAPVTDAMPTIRIPEIVVGGR